MGTPEAPVMPGTRPDMAPSMPTAPLVKEGMGPAQQPGSEIAKQALGARPEAALAKPTLEAAQPGITPDRPLMPGATTPLVETTIQPKAPVAGPAGGK